MGTSLTVSEECLEDRSANLWIGNAYIGHIMIDNYKIYLVLCVELIVFFAIHKSYRHDMHRIVCAFTDNTMLNDRLVDRFVRKLK